jgi:hypothetical protein
MHHPPCQSTTWYRSPKTEPPRTDSSRGLCVFGGWKLGGWLCGIAILVVKMSRSTFSNVLTILWAVVLMFGLLVWFTPLAISPYRTSYWILSIVLTGLPIVTWFEKRTKTTALIALGTFLFFNGAIATYATFLDWRGEWKTQTVIYQHVELPNRTIEFQLQDIGSLGYNSRQVESLKLLPFMEWTNERHGNH